MDLPKSILIIKCGKHIQNSIRDYLAHFNDAQIVYINSAEEIDIRTNTKEPVLLITEINSSKSIPSKFVTQYKQKASRKKTPVLYLTDKPIQNFQFEPGSNQGIYDILQLPVPQEVFLNKIKLFLQFHKLQYSDQKLKDIANGKKNQKKGLNSLEQQIQKRTEQLTNEIEEHIKTKIALQEKVNKIDETTSFLELLIEGIPLPVFIKNEKGEYIKCNKEFEKFTERPRGNIYGKKIFDITAHKIADKINRDDMEIIKSGQGAIHEEIFRKLDGSVINIIVHKNVFLNEQNNARGIIGTVFDITEIKRTEKLLKIQHTIDYLSALKMGMPAALNNILKQILELEWVDGGGIYMYNKEKEEAKLVCSSGLSEEFNKSVKVYKKDCPQLKFLLKKEPLYGSYHKIAAEKKFKEKEENFNLLAIIPMVNPENNELAGSLNLISRRHGKITKQEKSDLEFIVKSLVSLITYAQSQEELKELNKRLKKTIKEQQTRHQYLIQKSKLESLGELSAGIAHEINQPLGILSMSIENLQSKISSNQLHLHI